MAWHIETDVVSKVLGYVVALPFIYFAFWTLRELFNFARNYLKAHKMGFPFVAFPIPMVSLFWLVTAVPMRSTYRRYLSKWLFDRVNLTIYGFEFHNGYTPHAALGRNFVHTSCAFNILHIAEPEMANEVLRRPNDFLQTPGGEIIIGRFGSNVLTSNGANWAKQRKMVASNVNERISNLVFQVSVRQASEMMDYIVNDKQGVTNDHSEFLKRIAINVLGRAGYGVDKPWKQEKEEPVPGYTMTYMEATKTVIDHIIEVAVTPVWLLLLPIMPQSIQKLGTAAKEFPAHLRMMLDSERKNPSGNVCMLNLLVKESDAAHGEKGGASIGLTEDEILGNLFVFTAAGFDTTANTMTYAMLMLATYPEWQDWICEEIDTVLKDKGDELEYNEVHPKLVRVLALMYETLRKFPAVVHIARTAFEPTTLYSATTKKTYHLPSDTHIYVNQVAVHLDPATWGEDADTFRPDRFITTSSIDSEKKEAIINLPKGTFVPWSGGPRTCPGAKMSQVEFVSVFTTIFRRYKVELVLLEDETMEQGRKRIEAHTRDSQSKLTLQVNDPRAVSLRFVRR